jgi:hypothetical protein
MAVPVISAVEHRGIFTYGISSRAIRFRVLVFLTCSTPIWRHDMRMDVDSLWW